MKQETKWTPPKKLRVFHVAGTEGEFHVFGGDDNLLGFSQQNLKQLAGFLQSTPSLYEALRELVSTLTIPDLSDPRANAGREALYTYAPELLKEVRAAERALAQARGEE